MPEHPFVACLIDGVPVNALLDTGSMKSFISDKVHNIFDCGRLDKSQSQRCTSITGGDLNIADLYRPFQVLNITIIVLFLLVVIYHMIVFWDGTLLRSVN